MDLEEWELLPDDGFLEIQDDGEKKIYSRKYGNLPRNVFQMNYFICPSPKSQQTPGSPENPGVPNHLVPVPIQLEPTIGKSPDHEPIKEITEIPTNNRAASETSRKQESRALVTPFIAPSVISEKIKAPNIGAVETDQDPVSQVFFKKMKETEFVDMKIDSPRSSSRGVVPQIDAGEAFEAKNSSTKKKLEKEMVTKNMDSDIKEEVTWEENNGGMNIWKWSLTGIGAICSFGVAAATICIIIMGSQKKTNQNQKNQKLQYQIYSNDKRIKQVVHHASKVNEAISAVRGVPITRAQITFGGYYDGL